MRDKETMNVEAAAPEADERLWMAHRSSLVRSSLRRADVVVRVRETRRLLAWQRGLWTPAWVLISALLTVGYVRFSVVYAEGVVALDVIVSLTAIAYFKRWQSRSMLRFDGQQLWRRAAFGERRLLQADSVARALEVPVRQTLGVMVLQGAAGKTLVGLSLNMWAKDEIERLLGGMGKTVVTASPCRDLQALAESYPGSTRCTMRNVAFGVIGLIAALVAYLFALQAVFGLPPITGP